MGIDNCTVGEGAATAEPPQTSERAESRPFTADLETPEPGEGATSPRSHGQSVTGRDVELAAPGPPSQGWTGSFTAPLSLCNQGGLPTQGREAAQRRHGEPARGLGRKHSGGETGERGDAGLVRGWKLGGDLCWPPAIPRARPLFRGAGPQVQSQRPFATSPEGGPPAEEQPCAQAASPPWAATHQG